MRSLISIVTLLGYGLLGSGAYASPGTASNPASALFLANCAACHGSDLEGSQFGPSLRSASFASKWMPRPDDLLEKIKKTMPPGRAGTLDAAAYEELAAFVRTENGQFDGAASPADDNRGLKPIAGVGFAPREAFEDAPFHSSEDARKKLLDGLTPVNEDMLAKLPAQDWLTWRGANSRQSFSTQTAIHKTNVSQLSLAWAWSLPNGANEIEPLVHDGVMFINSANEIQALDATTGVLLWRYQRDVPPKYTDGNNSKQRNMALYGNKVYAATPDRHLIALDMKTGALIWDKEIVPVTSGLHLSAGPIVAHGTIIQAAAGGAVSPGGCYVLGFDPETGAQRWKFNTIPHPGEAGNETWNGAAMDEASGAGVWSAPSYDAKIGLIYFGVAQTYRAATLMQPPKPGMSNDGLYTDSTVALDPETGRVAWYHQHLARELYDMDEAFERVLLTVPVNGVPRDAVATMGKMGILDVLDRRDGKFLFAIDSGIQNFITSIDPVTGKRTMDPAAEPEANVRKEICPASVGAKNWRTSAYDAQTGLLYVPLMETCMTYAWTPNDHPKTPLQKYEDISYIFKPPPHFDGNYARFVAMDLKTHKIAWTKRSRAPLATSLLATAGGLVFSGSADRQFKALDSRTGDVLWSTTLSSIPNASPITYSVGGEQYVAVVSGEGSAALGVYGIFTPEIQSGPVATTVWVFKLPSVTKKK